jgi:hypothetical protein
MQVFYRLINIATLISMVVLPAQAAEPQHEHMKLAADVAAFHSAIAPLWHAPKGAERIGKACAQAGELQRLALDIKSTDASALQAATGQFQEQCKTAPDQAEGAFGKLHDAFHKLAMHKHQHGQSSASKPEQKQEHQH